MSEDLHFSTYLATENGLSQTTEDWVSEDAEAAWDFYCKNKHVPEHETEFCTLELIHFFQNSQFHGVISEGADEIVDLLIKQAKSVNGENNWDMMTQISWY